MFNIAYDAILNLVHSQSWSVDHNTIMTRRLLTYFTTLCDIFPVDMTRHTGVSFTVFKTSILDFKFALY
jgi:hypothetical protein